MKILVLSCDKNEDIFPLFHYCMEKNWKDHPEVIYATETIDNPYYKTIKKNYPLEKWSVRIRETLKEIDEEHILLMIDDIFIRKPVDKDRIQFADSILNWNIAEINFEKAFDNEKNTIYNGFKLKRKGCEYELSIMCGLWQKKALIDLLEGEYNPWEIEYNQNTKNYDFLINGGDYIIDWGYETFHHVGLVKGKWSREAIEFFKSEGIEIDYEKRGLID